MKISKKLIFLIFDNNYDNFNIEKQPNEYNQYKQYNQIYRYI